MAEVNLAPQTVFVIVRTTGEYSDRREDLIAATFDEAGAQRWAEETQRICQQIAVETNRAVIEADFEGEDAIRSAAQARCPDPGFEPWGYYSEDVQYHVWQIPMGLEAIAQRDPTNG